MPEGQRLSLQTGGLEPQTGSSVFPSSQLLWRVHKTMQRFVLFTCFHPSFSSFIPDFKGANQESERWAANDQSPLFSSWFYLKRNVNGMQMWVRAVHPPPTPRGHQGFNDIQFTSERDKSFPPHQLPVFLQHSHWFLLLLLCLFAHVESQAWVCVWKWTCGKY